MRGVISACGALGILLLFSGLTSPSSGGSVLTRRLASMIEEAGIRQLDLGRMLALSTSAALVAFVIVVGLTGNPFLAVLIALAACWMPMAYVRAARDKRRRSFRAAWPDALTSLVAGIRAGVSLPEVCSALAERGPVELRDAFRTYASTYRATGNFVQALTRMRIELADPVADRVVSALTLTHEVGGTDLVRVLRTLADFVREDLRIRSEIEARWSWTVTAARVAAASPWVVLILMSTRPEAAAAYDTPTGGTVILLGALATLCGYRAMLHAARLPEDRRLGT